jgi:hypothetical protein
MTVRRVAGMTACALAIVAAGAVGAQAQMRVPTSWSRRAMLPSFGSLERSWSTMDGTPRGARVVTAVPPIDAEGGKQAAWLPRPLHEAGEASVGG